MCLNVPIIFILSYLETNMTCYFSPRFLSQPHHPSVISYNLELNSKKQILFCFLCSLVNKSLSVTKNNNLSSILSPKLDFLEVFIWLKSHSTIKSYSWNTLKIASGKDHMNLSSGRPLAKLILLGNGLSRTLKGWGHRYCAVENWAMRNSAFSPGIGYDLAKAEFESRTR